MSDQYLSGQVAVVTGGAGLIGSAISRRLARLGAAVVVNGRDAAKAEALATQLRDGGAAAHAIAADVRDEASVAALVAGTIERFGRLDIMVANAGGGVGGYIKDLPLEKWSNGLALNLTAAFLCSKHAIPHMERQGYGRIVAISSAGYFGVKGQGTYAAAKSGLHGLIRSVALETAEAGITANVVAPHLVDSPNWIDRDPAIKAMVMDEVPIKRFAAPDEIAGSVAFLCSPDGGYITGEVLHVMGGMKAVGPNIDVSQGLRKRT